MGDLGAFKNALYAGGNITMVNYKNENIIHKAAWFGRLNILTSILEGPQNAQHIKGLVNSRDSAGCTPLHNAVIRNHYDMVDALMENGADPNIQV
jgi:ankyrin repeat protein